MNFGKLSNNAIYGGQSNKTMTTAASSSTQTSGSTQTTGTTQTSSNTESTFNFKSNFGSKNTKHVYKFESINTGTSSGSGSGSNTCGELKGNTPTYNPATTANAICKTIGDGIAGILKDVLTFDGGKKGGGGDDSVKIQNHVDVSKATSALSTINSTIQTWGDSTDKNAELGNRNETTHNDLVSDSKGSGLAYATADMIEDQIAQNNQEVTSAGQEVKSEVEMMSQADAQAQAGVEAADAQAAEVDAQVSADNAAAQDAENTAVGNLDKGEAAAEASEAQQKGNVESAEGREDVAQTELTKAEEAEKAQSEAQKKADEQAEAAVTKYDQAKAEHKKLEGIAKDKDREVTNTETAIRGLKEPKAPSKTQKNPETGKSEPNPNYESEKADYDKAKAAFDKQKKDLNDHLKQAKTDASNAHKDADKFAKNELKQAQKDADEAATAAGKSVDDFGEAGKAKREAKAKLQEATKQLAAANSDYHAAQAENATNIKNLEANLDSAVHTKEEVEAKGKEVQDASNQMQKDAVEHAKISNDALQTAYKLEDSIELQAQQVNDLSDTGKEAVNNLRQRGARAEQLHAAWNGEVKEKAEDEIKTGTTVEKAPAEPITVGFKAEDDAGEAAQTVYKKALTDVGDGTISEAKYRQIQGDTMIIQSGGSSAKAALGKLQNLDVDSSGNLIDKTTGQHVVLTESSMTELENIMRRANTNTNGNVNFYKSMGETYTNADGQTYNKNDGATVANAIEKELVRLGLKKGA